jgi:hypothetical protein
MSTTHDRDVPTPTGIVPTEGRGSLPFTLLHGESLVATASWALAEAGAELLDFNADWSSVQSREAALVVHDPLCPLTPVPFLRTAIAAVCSDDAAPHDPGLVVVAVRPVTDTVKTLTGGMVGATVDRSALVAVTSPVVLSAAVVAGLPDWPDLCDLGALVRSLGARFTVSLLEAPALGRRAVDESDVHLLEAFGATATAR